jgi:hypothetical protein
MTVATNMVLQDADNASGIIDEAARLLAPSGRFVATLLHPCFEVVEGSSWLGRDRRALHPGLEAGLAVPGALDGVWRRQ